MKEVSKKFTWADLKNAINEVPEELLNQEVVVWQEESGCKITAVTICEENYVDGGEGSEPESIVRDNYEGDDFENDHPVTFVKGSPVLLADN